MENLTLSDLCVLIPLLEKQLVKIHQDIDSDNNNISNEAADLSVPFGETAAKLETIYKSLWKEGSNYPAYEQLIERA